MPSSVGWNSKVDDFARDSGNRSIFQVRETEEFFNLLELEAYGDGLLGRGGLRHGDVQFRSPGNEIASDGAISILGRRGRVGECIRSPPQLLSVLGGASLPLPVERNEPRLPLWLP